MVLINIGQLAKNYISSGIETRVLSGIDLQVLQGDFLAIMGQSGSGKSTLMNILGCLDYASSGHYLLNGSDTSTLSRGELATIRNRFIGFVFQSFNLIKRMTVLENVSLPLIYAGVARAVAHEKARRELARMGLTEFALRFPSQLSGGQQQRVAIARALVSDPKLILADEPTGNLDSQTSMDIMRVFEELNAQHGITVILVTHEFDIATSARRLVHLKDGKVLYDGPVSQGLQQLRASHAEYGAQWC